MEIPSQITQVTVYPDRARLTRLARATLPAGVQQLEVRGLSHRLLPESARVSAAGAARARLLGMQLQKTFYTDAPAADVQGLEAQLEAVQDEINALQARIELIVQAQAHLNDLAGHTKVFAKALMDGRQSADEQLALFDRLRRRGEALEDESQALEVRSREAKRRQAQIQQQLEQARSQRPRQRYAALIDLDVVQAGDVTLEISYLISGASWSPQYDMRLGESDGAPALEVGYLAQVTQTSGEAWEDVALTLSTARPAQAAVIPELKPWYLRPQPPPRPLPAPQAKMSVARLVDAAPMTAGEGLRIDELAPIEEAMATVESGGAAVSYAIAGRATIPPDGSAYKAVIARYPLEPQVGYVSAPGQAPGAYRRVRTRNASAYTLLPGRANLFSGDEFIGQAPLALIAPQGEIELYFGVEDRIRVERKLARREVDKTIIGGKTRRRYGYEIEIENLLGVSAELLVRDQIPLGQHEEIKTRLEAAEPRPTRQTELNLLEWDVSLAPGEKRTLRFDFAVEAPQGMELFGLPG